MEPEGLTKKPWYYAKMSRQEAEDHLVGNCAIKKSNSFFKTKSQNLGKRDGSFVVRKSSQRDRLALRFQLAFLWLH